MELYVFGLAAVMILTVLIIQGIYCAFYCFYPLPGQKQSTYQNVNQSIKEKYKKKIQKRHGDIEFSLDDVEKRPATPSSDTARLTPSSLDTSAATRGETDV